MISKLVLTNFGKFQGVTFELAPVTLVYGPNEAGKTTFFDGLFQALCDPSETKKLGKLLKDRYGVARVASAVILNGVSVSDDEFMNLFAIRAGQFNLELSQGSEWMEKLKSCLFHGGIDPKILSEEFDKLSSNKKNHLHNKVLEAVRLRAEESRRELAAYLEKRQDLIVKESELKRLGIAHQEIGKLRKDADERLKALDAVFASEEKIGQRQKFSAQLGRLEDWQALEKEQKELIRFRDVRREDWESCDKAMVTVKAKLQVENGKLDRQSELVSQAQAECRDLQTKREVVRARSVAAAKLSEVIRLALANRAQAGRPMLWGFVGAGLLILSGGAGTILTHGLTAIAVAAVSLILSAGCAYFGWRHRHHLIQDGLEASLARWKDEWKLAVSKGGSTAMDSMGEITTVEVFLKAMEIASREQENLARQEQESLGRLHTSEKDLKYLQGSVKSCREELETTQQAEKRLLAGLEIPNGEVFLAKVRRWSEILVELPKRRADLDALAQGADLSTLERELLRKLKTLDEEGVSRHGLDEAAIQKLRREREVLEEQRKIWVTQEEGQLVSREGLAGEIRGAHGNLAADIVKCEDQLAVLEAEIREKELDKQSAALARDLFMEIGQGSDLLLSGLGKEMEAMLGQILPDGRGVTLRGLGSDDMQVADRGGGNRTLAQLSTGTRDAVVLAAKLALALKSREGFGILVLDEPFLAMDDARETRALELLRNFHVTHHWQIIILTKQAQLREKVLGLFSAPLIVDLS